MDWPAHTREHNFGCRATEHLFRGLRDVAAISPRGGVAGAE